MTIARNELLPSQVSKVSPTATLVPGEVAANMRRDKIVPNAFVKQTGGGDTTIKFTTTPSGVLSATTGSRGRTRNKPDLTGLARHETAHLLGANHPAIFAAAPVGSGGSVKTGSNLPSGLATQTAIKLQGNTSLRSHRIVTRITRENARRDLRRNRPKK